MDLGAGYGDDVLGRVDAGGDGPEHVGVVEYVHVLVHGDGHLGVLVLAGQRGHEHVPGLAVVARVHLHHEAEDARQHQHVLHLGATAHAPYPPEDLRRHGHLVVDAPFHLGAVLDVLEDGVAAHGDGVDVENRVLPRPRQVVVLELAEGAFLLAHVGKDLPFQHHLGLRRHLHVVGLALDHLHLLLQEPRSDGQLVPAVVRGGGGGEVEHGVVADHESHRHALALGLVLLVVGPAVARVEQDAGLARPLHLQAVEAQVAVAGVRVLGDHQAGGDERAAVADAALVDRQLRDVHLVVLEHALLDRTRGHDAGGTGRLRAPHEFRHHLVAVDAEGQRRQSHVARRLPEATPTGEAVEVFEQQRPLTGLPQKRPHLRPRVHRLGDGVEHAGAAQLVDPGAYVLFHMLFRRSEVIAARRVENAGRQRVGLLLNGLDCYFLRASSAGMYSFLSQSHPGEGWSRVLVILSASGPLM